LLKNRYIDRICACANNLDMTIVEITGGMLRAARSLTGLSQQELADEAEGVIFTSGGVHLQRPAPITGTVLHS
jgi:hypothetical protein